MVHMSLSTKEPIDRQNNNTFCTTILKLINEKKMSPERYFVYDEKALHKILREHNKVFHTPGVPQAPSKYVLHWVHNALGHNGTARTYQYLKWVHYWKGLWKDAILN